MELLAGQENLDQLDQLGHQDQVDNQEDQDKAVQEETLAHKDLVGKVAGLEVLDQVDQEVKLGQLVHRVVRVDQGNEEDQELLEFRVNLDHLVHQDNLDHQANPDHQGNQAQPDNRDPEEKADHLDQVDQLDLVVSVTFFWNFIKVMDTSVLNKHIN